MGGHTSSRIHWGMRGRSPGRWPSSISVVIVSPAIPLIVTATLAVPLAVPFPAHALALLLAIVFLPCTAPLLLHKVALPFPLPFKLAVAVAVIRVVGAPRGRACTGGRGVVWARVARGVRRVVARRRAGIVARRRIVTGMRRVVARRRTRVVARVGAPWRRMVSPVAAAVHRCVWTRGVSTSNSFLFFPLILLVCIVAV